MADDLDGGAGVREPRRAFSSYAGRSPRAGRAGAQYLDMSAEPA